MIDRSTLVLPVTALAACAGGEERWPYQVERSSGVTIVTELPEAESRLRNATTDYGTFFVENDCLQVRVGSAVFTPVLPRGSSYDLQAREIVLDSRRVQLSRQYSLPFAAEIGTEDGEAANAIGLPASCSRRLLGMGAPA